MGAYGSPELMQQKRNDSQNEKKSNVGFWIMIVIIAMFAGFCFGTVFGENEMSSRQASPSSYSVQK